MAIRKQRQGEGCCRVASRAGSKFRAEMKNQPATIGSKTTPSVLENDSANRLELARDSDATDNTIPKDKPQKTAVVDGMRCGAVSF